MSPVQANRLLSSLSNKLQHFHNEPETPCSLFHYEEQFMFSLSLVILLLKYLLDSLFLERHIFQKNRYKSKLKRSELKDISMLLSTSLKTQFWLVCLYHKIVTLLWPQYLYHISQNMHMLLTRNFIPDLPPHTHNGLWNRKRWYLIFETLNHTRFQILRDCSEKPGFLMFFRSASSSSTPVSNKKKKWKSLNCNNFLSPAS